MSKPSKITQRPFAPKPFHPGDWVRFEPPYGRSGAFVGQVWSRVARPGHCAVIVEGDPVPHIVRDKDAKSLGIDGTVEQLTVPQEGH